MDYEKKWKIIGDIGEGGQGKVYRVIGLDIYSKTKTDIIDTLKTLASNTIHIPSQDLAYEKFSKVLPELVRMQDPSYHSALKVLHKPQDARDANLAMDRIKREIKAMSENLHPNLIRILDFDPDSTWYVSKFYEKGTLDNNKDMFKGDFPRALRAMRTLVEGVTRLHKEGYVHRDIKPQNIFLNRNNELILGDFGLVYFEDVGHTRISATYENVGSRDWMPPWAMGMRIEDIKPSFDIFSLGKALWSMVSGKSILPLWYFNRNDFNVEKLFPEAQFIKFANPLFEKCIVEEEKNCIQDAGELLRELDETISSIRLNSDFKQTSTVDKDLQFESSSGTFLSKQTRLRYCHKCYHSSPSKLVELQERDNGWRCSVCDKFYPNPNWNPPALSVPRAW